MYVYDVYFYTEFVVCNEEEDSEWDILWSSTLGGRYDTQPCSGDGAVGMYPSCISTHESLQLLLLSCTLFSHRLFSVYFIDITNSPAC